MKKIIMLIIASQFVLYSCNTLKVTHKSDETADFSKYKTYSFYGWADASGENINELDKKRLEKAFAEEFNKRGLEFVKSNGDLIISLFIQIKEDYSTHSYIDHYNMGGYYGYYYAPTWGWGVDVNNYTYDTKDYYKGTLVVDAFDSHTKKLVWQSVGSRKINEDPEARERNTPKAAASMMLSFPIKKTKK